METQPRPLQLLFGMSFAFLGTLAFAGDSTLAPMLHEVVSRNATIAEEMYEPEHSFGGSYWELSNEDKQLFEGPARDIALWEWNYGIALEKLIGGDIAAFQDRLLQLEESVLEVGDSEIADRLRPERAERISLLYAWAGEAGVETMDVGRFQAVRAGMSTADNTPTRGLVDTYFAYLVNDEGTLKRVAAGAGFNAAYAAMLLSRLNPSIQNIDRAIDLFDTEHKQHEGEHTQSAGRIALHLAGLYLQRFGRSGDKSDLDLALEFCQLARANLEYLDSPLFWAAAHRQTAEVLEVLYIAHDQSDQIGLSRIRARLDRARELGTL
jgi:hypothetical protein